MHLTAACSLAGRHRRLARLGLTLALLFSLLIQATSFAGPAVSAAASLIKVPVPAGTTMQVTQGYNTDPGQGGSHYDCAEYPDSGCSVTTWNYKYSLDLVPTSGAAEGTTVLSPVSGTIRWIDTGYGGMSINLGNGWAVAYFHTLLAPGLAAGQAVTQGQYMGTIAPPGQAGNSGFAHIHVTVWETNDGGNWDRHAKPFAGTQALDGKDFAALGDATHNQHRGETVTSTNAIVGGTAPPRQVAKTSPAHGTTLTSATVPLTWQAATGATSYQVTLDSGVISSGWITATSWTTPPLATGSHTWQVQARNAAGTGTASSTWRFYLVNSVSETVLDNGSMIGTGKYRIFGTREGLVGGTTSSGHVIIPNDHFVSLPACVPATCDWLTPGTTDPLYGFVTDCKVKCYVMLRNPATNICRVEPVLDRGPLFNVDDYWNSTTSRFVNKKIADKGLDYSLAQGYPGDAAALDGYDVGWGKSGNIGKTFLADSTGGRTYVPSFPTSIDIGDGTWIELGLPYSDPGPNQLEVTMMWQVSQSVADAESACEGPPPYFTMSKSSGTAGTVITINGKYYGPGEDVRVYIDSSSIPSVNSVTADSTGRFTTSFTVPDTVGGSHKIIVAGKTTKRRVTKNFTILPRATISPTKGSANLSVTLTGQNFAGGETVRVYWDSSATAAGTGTADSTGDVSIVVHAPTVYGSHTAKLTGTRNGLSARTTYTVVQRVRTKPTSGSSATTVTVYGTGWPVGETVTFRWQSTSGTRLCSATTDSTGYVDCTFKPSASATNGTYRIYGTDGVRSASTTFTVTGFGGSDDTDATATETATATASPTETPVDGSPIATPIASETATPEASPTDAAPEETVTPDATETAAPAPTDSPTETSTAEPTATAEPVTVQARAVADTSVAWSTPDAPQSGDSITTLSAGGADGDVAYISFNVTSVGTGTVISASLVLTDAGDGGSAGPVGMIPGYVVDENGAANTLPFEGINAAYGSDGSVATVGAIGPGQQAVIDITLSVQADGQYTFVIPGDAASELRISSREGSAPPILILTVQP